MTAHLDLSRPQLHRVHRSLVHLFVGKVLGSARAAAEVRFRSAVLADRIESIAFPGDAGYDRFPLLPRL